MRPPGRFAGEAQSLRGPQPYQLKDGGTVGTMIDGRGPAGRLSTKEPPPTQPPPTEPNPTEPTPASAPAPPPRRLRRPKWSFRVAVVLALLAVAVTFAALVFTNLRISGRPALSTNDVNAIVNQKVSTAISQLQSQPPAAVTAYDAVRAGLGLIESQHRERPEAPRTSARG